MYNYDRGISGFTYPQINSDLCVECHLCEKSCPFLNKKDIDIEMRNAYAAISSDNFVRNERSSGGIFSELALEILKWSYFQGKLWKKQCGRTYLRC